MKWPAAHPEPFAARLLSHLGWSVAQLDQAYVRLGSFAAILESDPEDWPVPLRPVGRRWHKGRLDDELRAVEVELAGCERSGVSVLVRGSPDYPPLLETISRPPALLFIRGELNLLSMPQIAVVGSRRATRGGRETAAAFAHSLAGAGFCVTSGLALGIDAAAHRAALSSGRTLAVLGAGWDVIYPRVHDQLSATILDTGGAVVSEFAAGTPPLRENFPRRNRIISGLSCGVLVVEAALRSGSLITARLALEQGREVFAIPGSIHNALARGCHQLIREGALLVEEVGQIVAQLASLLTFHQQQLPGLSAEDEPISELDAGQRRLLEAIGFDPVSFDRLLEITGLPVGELSAELLSLELQARIEQAGGMVVRLKA